MPSDLRYPIGRLVKVPAYSSAERTELISTIADLPQTLRAAVEGLTEPQLDTPYREGGWSLRQVVHHLADSHLNAFIRFKWALTETDPMIKAYDERAWAELPDANFPLAVSLRLLDALHERWVGLLRAIPPLAFSRPYEHPETGAHTLDMALGVYAWHGRHHTAHVTELRRRQGW